MAPPRIPTRLLARVFRRHPAATAILGDLHEDFVRMARDRGAGSARLWYWREALGLATSRIVHELARNASRRRVATFFEDLGWALRTLRRAPGFALFMALVIGVGVAAVTTVYSVLAPLALALPLPEAEQLVWIANVDEAGEGSLAAVTSRVVNLIDFRERATSFEGITGYDAFFAARPYTLTGLGEPERRVGVGVAGDFLPVLGIEPLHGRSFTTEEAAAGGPAAVVLDYGFWRDRLGADAEIVGRTLTLNDRPHTVVGVLPADFDFSSVFTPGRTVDFLVPFPITRDHLYQGNVLALVGRLRRGVDARAAGAELASIVSSLQAEEPARWGLAAVVVPLREHLAGPFRQSFTLLVAAAGTLLLVVCVNVSSLILARLPSRAREMAVRKALGAARDRLIRQLMLESLGVSLVGAAFAAVLADLATRSIRGSAGLRIPLSSAAAVDGSALALALGVAVVTGLAVAILPALRIADGDEADVLRAGHRGSSAGRAARRLQESLVVGEVALTCALLVVGALLLASFQAVLAVDLGFEPRNVVAWQLQPSTEFATPAARSDFYARLAAQVSAAPGVESAGLIDATPLGRNRSWPFFLVDRPEEADTDEEVFPHVVDPGYLSTLGIPLRAGREFTAADRDDASPVVMLNETGARRIFGGTQEALGRRLMFFGPWEWEVVGVVADVRHVAPEMGSGTEVYFPLAQMIDYTTMDLVVRSPLPPARVAEAVSTVLGRIDPAMPTREFWSLERNLHRATSDRRFALGILSTFGLVAMLLAGIGIYGVLARSVAERRPEIGIRMVLGASAGSIVRDVVGRVLVLTGIGIAGGWGLSLLLTGLLESVLFGVSAVEPPAFLGTALLLLGLAIVAAALPARRAACTDAARSLGAQ